MKTAIIGLIALAVSATAFAREFKDATGRTIEAELVSVSGTEVTILRAGTEFTLPIAKFSEVDQEFIHKWAKSQTPSSKPAAACPKPGETLKFDFPELIKDFKGEPASFSVKIPTSYDPGKPIGLMVFLGGGNGSSSPGGATGLTNDDFVCAGLPYPDDGRNPAQDNMVGSFDEVWEYWQPMLAKLNEAVPNIDPNLRVIGGFSNGAHAIDGVLAEKEFANAFTAFILIDGGGVLGGNYREVKDKHAYIAWGEKSPAANSSQDVVKRAKRGRMIVVENEMEGVGHAFPASEKVLVKKWLYETVVPAAGKTTE
ncbi:MAG: hypothetical protein ACI8UO_000554 [Verrucomicrobiales bacterium]|jgi:hypothetical protein